MPSVYAIEWCSTFRVGWSSPTYLADSYLSSDPSLDLSRLILYFTEEYI